MFGADKVDYTALEIGVGGTRHRRMGSWVRWLQSNTLWLLLLAFFFVFIYVCLSQLPRDEDFTKIRSKTGRVVPNKEIRPLYFRGPQNSRQRAVVEAFKHAWSGYKTYAWGKDELKPVSKSFNTEYDVGMTIVDSLDTMYIMGLNQEFAQARDWVAKEMALDINKYENLFEVTIRVLGGLLGAYHLSADPVFLNKATDLGDRLLPAFESKSHVPFIDVNLKTHRAMPPRWGLDSSIAEVTTIQLEFRDLSRITGNSKYEEVIDEVTDHVHQLPKKDGLVPILINTQSGKFRQNGAITFGSGGDSYYEYLLKSWIQTGKTRESLKTDYVNAVDGMRKHLLKESQPNQLLYVGELPDSESFSPKMDHLACFLGSILSLGTHHGLDKKHLLLGKRLTSTCYEMYRLMPTGLSPEIVFFNEAHNSNKDLNVQPGDEFYRQRPETVEALFYLYRITRQQQYRDWGWKIFQAIEKYTKIPSGYASIKDVTNTKDPGFNDKMETFFLGETLKYLYLLFSDSQDEISLDEFVFNTEAHPLPIYKS